MVLPDSWRVYFSDGDIGIDLLKEKIDDMMLPNDVSRCANERCKKKLKCKRYLDCLPWETYWYGDFNEEGCEFFIENELKNEK